jgi:ABC-type sugar transport system ATPase subunit
VTAPNVFAIPAPEASGAGGSALRATGITKRFGGIRALRGADLTLMPSQIHGLIGENGSGKSTLLGILSGQLGQDAGTISVQDQALEGVSCSRRLASTVAFVTQELSLAPELTVAENILLSHRKPRSWRGIRWKELNRQASTSLAKLGLDIDPTSPVCRLRVDEQQLVEIARAVEVGAPVLILDEPTSSLTEDGVQALAKTMRRLRDHGTSIVFVSHRLDEMLDLTDHITVLRDGQTVDSRPTAAYTKEILVEAMLGHAPEQYAPPKLTRRHSTPLLRVRNLSVPGRVTGVSLDVHPGEVVGLVGLAGAGRTELLEAIFGARADAVGDLECAGKSRIPQSPLAAIIRGMALVPADRKLDGLFLDMSITSNIAVARSACDSRLRRLRRGEEDKRASATGLALRLQQGSNARTVGSLSGGNQQKVLLGKWLETEPTLLMLDEPTRGVDVGAKQEIHRLIHDIRDRGLGVIVSSSDIEELMLLSDRFVVMFRGTVVAEVDRDWATEARLSHLATGGSL